MSVIEEALVARLLADATVAAAVGTRIYPMVAPQEAAMPLITYQRISGLREHTHDQSGDLARPRFQVTAMATTYAVAKTLINAVRECLDCYCGVLSGVTVDAIYVENESDVFNMASDQSKSSYATWLDFVVWHHE